MSNRSCSCGVKRIVRDIATARGFQQRSLLPRAGAPAVEVTVSDGRGSVVGVFLGRRKIPGMSPGHRVLFSGVAGRDGNRYLVMDASKEALQSATGYTYDRTKRVWMPATKQSG